MLEAEQRRPRTKAKVDVEAVLLRLPRDLMSGNMTKNIGTLVWEFENRAWDKMQFRFRETCARAGTIFSLFTK